MTDQEELRDDVPPKEDDETWQMGEQENEPSPHQGEEGQEEGEA
jgi:hypothetical protein